MLWKWATLPFLIVMLSFQFGSAGEVDFSLDLKVLREIKVSEVPSELPTIEVAQRKWSTPGVEQSSRITRSSARFSWDANCAPGTSCWLDDSVWPLTREFFFDWPQLDFAWPLRGEDNHSFVIACDGVAFGTKR